MMTRSSRAACLLAISVFLTASGARAQVPNQVYDDVKSVIQDLIEKDVAQNVVPNLSCQAPITIVYFPTTLQRVFDLQFGGVRAAIQGDAADLAGSLVYYALTAPPAAPGDLLRNFIQSEQDRNSLGDLAGDAKCGEHVRSSGGPLHYKPGVRTLLDAKCSKGEVSIGCDLGRATKDLASGDTVAAEGEIRLAIAEAITEKVDTSSAGDIAKVEAVASLLQRYIAAFAGDPGADPKTTIDLYNGVAAAPQDTTRGTPDSKPTAATGSVELQGHAKVLPNTPARNEPPASNQPQPKPQSAVRTLPAFVDTADFQNATKRAAREWNLATGGGKSTLTLASFVRYSLMAADDLAICATASECKNLRKLVADGAADLRKIVEAASARDVATIAVDVLRAIFLVRNRNADQDCPGHPSTFVTLASATADVKRFNLATQTNVEQPAKSAPTTNVPTPAPPRTNVASSAADTNKTPDQTPECERQVVIQRYGQFLAALAEYTIEVATTNNPTTETRTAFESAAFDVMQTDGPRTGMSTPFGWNILIPEPALRFSWNQGYVNEATGDGVRYLATVDWLTFRGRIHYTSGTYVALGLSLVDLLGPFAESALRRRATYDDSSLEWANFLNPRLEVLFGVPSLTRHVAFVGGVSYRAAAVATNNAGTLKYYSPFEGVPSDYRGGNASYYSQFVEASLGVKYLP
jgi:hypothetical protein